MKIGARRLSILLVLLSAAFSAIGHGLNVDRTLLGEISVRNPWAALVLISLQRNGDVAELGSGTTVLGNVPTTEAVEALLRGNSSLLRSMPTPSGVLARVTHRLEHGPGATSRLFLSSFTVDRDDRMMFKVYPDIVVEVFEASPEKIARDRLGGRSLIARTWRVAE